jgi:Zn-dependent alcohol dehydrogenase
MKTRAAVAFEKGKPLTVTEAELDGPKGGEVLIEVKATGIATPTTSRCQAPTRKVCFRLSSATKAPASWSTSGRT